MDLKISGRKALVCASSKGLGFGCAMALANAGVNITMCARNESQLMTAAKKIREIGVDVSIVVCDITSEDGLEKVLTKIQSNIFHLKKMNLNGCLSGD